MREHTDAERGAAGEDLRVSFERDLQEREERSRLALVHCERKTRRETRNASATWA